MNAVIESFLRTFFGGTPDIPQPSDWLRAEAAREWMKTYPWKSLIVPLSEKPKMWIPYISATKSMLPVLGSAHNTLLLAGATTADHRRLINHLKVGDIAVYHNGTDFVLHRIDAIKFDKEGKYYVFKGDNNRWVRDPFRVRAVHIQWISVVVAY